MEKKWIRPLLAKFYGWLSAATLSMCQCVRSTRNQTTFFLELAVCSIASSSM